MNNIKNFKSLTVLALAVVVLSSCGEKEEEGISKADIVGNWTINSSTTIITVNNKPLVEFLIASSDTIDREYAEAVAALNSIDFVGYMNFKSDDSYSMDLGSGQFNGSWALNADGKQLLLDENKSNEKVWDLLSICSTSMILSFTESGLGKVDGDDTPDMIEYRFNIALIK